MSFPSSLSEPISTADSEVEARNEGRGRETHPSKLLLSAACDDWADKDKSVLHVQESLAPSSVHCLPTVLSADLHLDRRETSKQRPDSRDND